MYSKKNKNIFLSLATSFGLLVMGLCLLTTNFAPKNFVLAEQTAPSYFSAKVNNTNYTSGQSVFLDDGQKLVINFGKPVGNAIENTYEVYGSQEEIGEYAVSWEIGSFKLNINGLDIANLQPYFDADLIKRITYFYAPNYNPENPTGYDASFGYLTIEIDLEESTLFPTGKYEITFENYKENTGVDFEVNSTKSYSATFYIFNTTDYFAADNATTQNLDFDNVRSASPIGATYKNYYFFNYANIIEPSTTYNYLPSLTFDAGKFIVSVTKSVQGTSETCTISKFTTNKLITLGTNSTQNFVDAVFDEETQKITIYFQDIGDYRLTYQFVYDNNGNSYTSLISPEITNVNKKADMLYVYGYQLNYSDSITKAKKEFKLIENGLAGGVNSADVSYTLNYESLKNVSLSALVDDTAIFNAISGLTPASTNQPAVFANSNVTINQANSYYYKLDEETNDWAKLNDTYIKNTYLNTSFTDPGTYLLKTVYTFQNNLNSNGNNASNVYFVQYFYFNITNDKMSVSMAKLETVGETTTETTISSNSYTRNSVKITLPGQSVFNSPVSVSIFSKEYTSSVYSTSTTITANTSSQSQTVSYNKNYKVVINYVNNKSQTSYFTIDNTSFQNVGVYNVTTSTSISNQYIKNTSNPVVFFTNKSVAIQWAEKASGATSSAYYKYIPFVQTSASLPNASQFANDFGIAVDYAMNFDVGGSELATIKYNNTSNSSLLQEGSILSSQGFYIIKLTDSAGNWQYITFCIDKTQIKMGQISNGEYRTVQNYNVVSIDTELQWGKFKLINTNIAVNQLATTTDIWVKDVFVSKLNEITGDNDILASEGKYYFAPEISPTSYVLIGNTFVKNTDLQNYVINLEKTIGDKTFANEISYVFYLIDESNPYFNLISSLSQSDFVKNASLAYKITTTSDASMANILLNNSSTNPTDVSAISYNSANLNQAGFADSFTTAENNMPIYQKADLRTKYYYATGATVNGNVQMLSYIFLPNPSDYIAVEKIEVFYFPFIIENGIYKLSNVAVSTVVYDLTNNINATTALSGDFANYFAFNLNSAFSSATGQNITFDGKYVVVRTYTASSTDYVSNFDFMTRESSFIVDRENIVSLPSNINGNIFSIIGQEIYVNVLDGSQNSIQFTQLALAYNTDAFILETNKLPVVVYVPISKYGYDISENNKLFTLFDALQKFYTTTTINNQTFLNRYSLSGNNVTSIFEWSYFGASNINLTSTNNPSFDLSVVLEYSSTIGGAKTVLTMTKNTNETQNYFSNLIRLEQEGYYYVTISQNAINGLTYPNTYSTFSFIFYISEKKPTFDFVEVLENNQDGDILNTDANNVSYTNANSIKIEWEDPIEEYMAKIDLTNENGNAKGIYYYTDINTKYYLNLNTDIVTDGRKHYAIIDISRFPTNTVLYFYMQYEGLQNTSSSVTKILYIDRVAPESVLSQMIAQTLIEGTNVASFSRQYADNTQKYSVLKTQNTDAFAYYAFALPLTSSILNSYFNPQNADDVYYKNGFYYNFKLIENINTYEMTSINFAKDPRVSHNLTISTSTLSVNKYYEVIERDLAGNISIYVVYFVQNNADLQVLTFDKESTQYNTLTNIKYSELQEVQTIYAKSFFNVNQINLYNYPWLTFSVDGIKYQKSPKLENNTFYDITNWSNTSILPNIVTLTEIMNWSSSNQKHTLIIVDPTKTINYTFNIFVSNEVLSITPLSSGEGVNINGNSYASGLSIFLKSLTISSWETDRYVEIYNGTNTFSSTNYVTFTATTNRWTFTILSPRVAYKYTYIDNFGNANIFYHTCGEIKIPDNEKIVGFVDKIVIGDEELGYQNWSVGYGNVEYNYNNVDYEVYINLQVLIFNTDLAVFEWHTITPTGITNANGSKIYAGISTAYYSCSVSTKSNSINKIVLIAPSSTQGITNFTGGITRYIITLLPTKVDINGNTIQDQPNPDYVLINNLSPNISLIDKNGTNKSDLINSSAIFAGQLTINIPRMTFVNGFVFPIITKIQFNNEEEIVINSGTSVESAGTYYLKTYIVINDVQYLYSVKTFIISESSSNFYNVMVFNSTTNEWQAKQSTGKVFSYDNKYYSSHYIVNTQNYNITLNEEQEIELTEIVQSYTTPDGVITRFYKISNSNSNNKMIKFYTNYIAVTYISTSTLLPENGFYCISTTGQTTLSDVSKQIVITSDNSTFTNLKVVFNTYYGIPENFININITYDDNEEFVYTPKIFAFDATKSYVVLTHSGNYTISFSDQAGNVQIFQDKNSNIIQSNYKLTYINGVSFYINGNVPIENGIYNNSIVITLPQNLNTLYEKGSQPKITVLKNNLPITITANANKEYIISGSGYYEVYFDAKINNMNVKRQITKFTIINNNEFRWAFEYSQYSNYEIVSVLKNNVEMDYSNYFHFNTYTVGTATVKYLKNILISLYDEITGEGNYQITIKTNSNIQNEMFTFGFKIKNLNTIPLTISTVEGSSTTNTISVSFNAYDVFNNLGECKILVGDQIITINQSYLDNITNTTDYYKTYNITKTGTYFIQIVTDSDKVLYSYKVMKAEPLNAFSVVIIVFSVLAVSALVVTFVLLRRNMKIK
ncbi:MAG: hypothetical protein PHQ62_00585 [Clostridia bacterium]|nr:hypothetical protein [Clostridia bacterium]